MKSPNRNSWFTFAVMGAIGAASNTAVAAPASNAAQVVAVAASATNGTDTEQRVRDALRVVMAGLIENGAFGDQSPQQIALAVDAPAQRISDLGLLVDSTRSDHDGLHVLGVTPGGHAEQMGLRAGDVLVALNGESLTDDADAAGRLRRTIDGLPDGSPLGFDVRRNGSTKTVSGTLSSVTVPAMHLTVGADAVQLASNASTGNVPARMAAEGCGRISDFDVAPRQQQLHSARIISIDGITPGPSGAKAFRVAAGQHRVKVSERIESRYLGFNDRARNAGPSSDRYKTLMVDVAPDTTTLIAARLNEEQRDVPSKGAYWDPVAWKQVAEPCR